jgi:two-component system, LytTR family, sensor kinase
MPLVHSNKKKSKRGLSLNQNKRMDFTRRQRFLIELSYFILIFALLQLGYMPKDGTEWLLSIVSYCILYLHCVVNRYFIFDYLFPQKRYGTYILLTIVNLLAFNCIYFGFLNLAPQDKLMSSLGTEKINFFCAIPDLFLSIFILSSLEFFIRYTKAFAAQNAQEKLLHNLETQNLKSQLNPHFLFNSLNSAYALSISRSEDAPQYILSLSQLMRYQIESVRKDKVSLAEEIDFIKNLIDVEKIRLSQRCEITLNIADVSEDQLPGFIAPLMLLPFLENAVKHGTCSIDRSRIDVCVKTIDNQLHFECSNSISSRGIKAEGTGTGLINVKNRLSLTYPGHELSITAKPNSYIVRLTLPISRIQ